jgi:hypothetical protein
VNSFAPLCVAPSLQPSPVPAWLFTPTPAFLLPCSIGADVAINFLYNPAGDGVTFTDWPDGYTAALVFDTQPTATSAVAAINGANALTVIWSAVAGAIPGYTRWRLLVNIAGPPTVQTVAVNGVTVRADGHGLRDRNQNLPFLFPPPPASLLPLSYGSDLAVDLRYNPSGDGATFVDWPPNVAVSFVVDTVGSQTTVGAVVSGPSATIYLPAAVTNTIVGKTLWRVLANVTDAFPYMLPLTFGTSALQQVVCNGSVRRADGYDRPPGVALTIPVTSQPAGTPVIIVPTPGVPGTPGPPGGYQEISGEILTGQDGVTDTFTLANLFVANTTEIRRNGLDEVRGVTFFESPPNQIVFATPPLPNDTLVAKYLTI